ncbi:unnamed protein product [Paramecium sonneborni]|uniref:Protein kinase domain-containing protein n=1 Tax=Paramecium sonneborni TaxID=65129 RepID=A0A8S1MDE7_9CILI|nr:unnamed protein product [Paramecium sonneborni]
MGIAYLQGVQWQIETNLQKCKMISQIELLEKEHLLKLLLKYYRNIKLKIMYILYEIKEKSLFQQKKLIMKIYINYILYQQFITNLDSIIRSQVLFRFRIYQKGEELFDYICIKKLVKNTMNIFILPQIAAQLFIQLINAFMQLHRDLKPENLHFNESNNLQNC